MAHEILLGFDYGAVHIGVAIACNGEISRLQTLHNDEKLHRKLQKMCDELHPQALVVGWPRGLDGQHTAQTEEAERFAKSLEQYGVPVHLQDEAVTSDMAKARIGGSLAEQKRLIHEESAVIILEDYVQTL